MQWLAFLPMNLKAVSFDKFISRMKIICSGSKGVCNQLYANKKHCLENPEGSTEYVCCIEHMKGIFTKTFQKK